MKIGMVSDGLGHLPFTEMLDTAKSLGISGVEINSANWTAASHCDLAGLVKSADARKTFKAAFDKRGLELIALNANGNQLHPTDGERQSKGLYDTITLAGQLEVKTVVLMSGLPAGAPGDKMPNWVVSFYFPRIVLE